MRSMKQNDPTIIAAILAKRPIRCDAAGRIRPFNAQPSASNSSKKLRWLEPHSASLLLQPSNLALHAALQVRIAGGRVGHLLESAHADLRDVSDRAIDTHVKNLRRKLQAVHAKDDCIASVYGVGYRFDAPVA